MATLLLLGEVVATLWIFGRVVNTGWMSERYRFVKENTEDKSLRLIFNR